MISKSIDYKRLDPLELSININIKQQYINILHRPSKKRVMVELEEFDSIKEAGQQAIILLDKMVYGL